MFVCVCACVRAPRSLLAHTHFSLLQAVTERVENVNLRAPSVIFIISKFKVTLSYQQINSKSFDIIKVFKIGCKTLRVFAPFFDHKPTKHDVIKFEGFLIVILH